MAARAFKANQAGVRRIATGPEIRRVVTEAAEKGKAYAESISPRDDDAGEHYQDSFVIDEITVLDVGRTGAIRAGAALRNTVGHAAAVEWGNDGNGNKAHRVLGRTLDYLRRA